MQENKEIMLEELIKQQKIQLEEQRQEVYEMRKQLQNIPNVTVYTVDEGKAQDFYQGVIDEMNSNHQVEQEKLIVAVELMKAKLKKVIKAHDINNMKEAAKLAQSQKKSEQISEKLAKLENKYKKVLDRKDSLFAQMKKSEEEHLQKIDELERKNASIRAAMKEYKKKQHQATKDLYKKVELLEKKKAGLVAEVKEKGEQTSAMLDIFESHASSLWQMRSKPAEFNKMEVGEHVVELLVQSQRVISGLYD